MWYMDGLQQFDSVLKRLCEAILENETENKQTFRNRVAFVSRTRNRRKAKEKIME